MNIQDVFQALQSASDFELFRLRVAIDKLLEDPERNNALRKKLVVGMQLEYFDAVENRAIACEVIEIKRTRATVYDRNTERNCTLPFYFLNLDHVATDLVVNNKKGMSKAELSIGSAVGFISSKDNQEYNGRVEKLNPKRAVILVDSARGELRWTVPYSMLFPIIQSTLDDGNTLLLAN
jgi:hypothetical protein